MLKSFVVLAFFLSPLALCGQEVSSEPFKKANTIIILTELSSEDAFIKWGRHLVLNGYSLESKDESFLTLLTDPKDTSKWNYDFKIQSTITDLGEILIKIKFRLKSNAIVGTDATNFYEWEYAKSKGNVQNVIHNDILEVINSFGDYKVVYEKR